MKHEMHDNNSHIFIETYLEIQETEYSSHAYKEMRKIRRHTERFALLPLTSSLIAQMTVTLASVSGAPIENT